MIKTPTWCPGCGNWAIWQALKQAFFELKIPPPLRFLVFGVGCLGNMNDFLEGYAIHSLHGRAIPNAIGIKLANHRLPVVAIVGDGDCYGEGGNHFVHACRGNHDITVIVSDNRVYGLTTGQVSPTAFSGFKSKSTPFGVIEKAFNPLLLALSSGATFVSQGFAGDISHLKKIIKKAILHQGFSLVNVLQPCVSFNKINTYEFYKKRIYYLPEDKDNSNLDEALIIARSQENEKWFPVGVLYQKQEIAFHKNLTQLKEKTLVEKERFKDYHKILALFE